MKRNTKIALVLCLAVLGTAIEARAQCRDVHGSLTGTTIPAPNDPIGRGLNIVLGVLNGAGTAVITNVDTSSDPVLKATSFDVFWTNRGDMLTATGAITLTPVPGKPPGEFKENATLTITGGSGEYAGATGTITLEGQAHNFFSGPGVTTFNDIYQGSVCGPNIRGDGN
jgi:hypothetical protein